MSSPIEKTRLPFRLAAGATAGGALVLLAFSSGVQPGSSGVPPKAAQMLPACGACHNPAPGGPQVSLTVSKYALQPGEGITVTTSATGGVAGNLGGFLAEATAGTFTAGGNSQVNSGASSITHVDRNSRSWTYGYTAPARTGLVELFTVVNTVDGRNTSGDLWAFHGYDNTATVSTPVRLFVLPTGVVDVGPGCPDGYGNQSVMGASSVPVLGNSAFGFELHGATPSSFALLLAGFNPSGFRPIDLGSLFGLTGCSGYVANPITLSGLTSGGNVQRADGAIGFPVPIPSSPVFQGATLDVQGAYLDPSASSLLGRALPASFSNGLRVSVQ